MRLNEEQQLAVDTIDGPVLVVAGPGTGKTQLLAARVLNILEKTDADPGNILCLTFTNDGARNMRERLRSLIGEASYKVTVGTYHEFGASILRDYPEYFLDRRYLTLIDELKSYQIFNGLVEEMSYTNALRYKEWNGVRSLVGDMKQANLTPTDLREIAAANNVTIARLELVANEIFPPRMPSKLDAVRPMFEKWRDVLKGLAKLTLKGVSPQLSTNDTTRALEPLSADADSPRIVLEKSGASLPSLAQTYLTELDQAMQEAEESGKTTALSKYKSGIMERVDERFHMKARKGNDRLLALADAYEKYNNIIRAEGLYDFDDIILAAIRALEAHADLRAELQEKYQYVLLDEYQDTNAAQSRIVELLLDNPVWENRPNVLAVGDDDQAIYAFQGALASNLTDFYNRYDDVKLINLSKNYRSRASIVEFAASFRKTIADSVYKGLAGQDKELVPAGEKSRAVIERIDFKSDVAERNWVGAQIKELLAAGVDPGEIAVLARTNAELDSVAKHLGGVKIRYDRQNDILTEQRIVREFLDLCRLLVAIVDKSPREDELAAKVFYASRWKLSVAELYKISRSAKEAGGWISAMLASKFDEFQTAATEVAELAGRLNDAPLTEVVYELSRYRQADDAELYVLNSAILILQKAVTTEAPTLRDLVHYADAMIAAGLNLLDQSPYRAAEKAVSLLSAHKAKGLEFEYVFIIGAHNANWVKTGSHRGSTLPPNMAALNYAGDRDDDQRRLLYVAATRAKNALYITRAKADFAGTRSFLPIEYFDERDEDGRSVAWALPEGYQEVKAGEGADEQPTTEVLSEEVSRLQTSPDLAIISEQFTADYVLTASDVNTFIDSEYGGAVKFYRERVLKCPSAPSRSMVFGTLVHAVLQDVAEAANRGEATTKEQALLKFQKALAESRGLSENEKRLLGEQGEFVLPAYLEANSDWVYTAKAQAEKWFSREKSGVRMWGKVDRIESDGKTRTVVDFKTGKASGANDDKTHKARVQLYIYKMLVEGEIGAPVTKGRVEFVSADSDGKASRALEIEFNPEEELLVWKLVQLIWKRIMRMDFRELTEAQDGGSKTFREFLEAKIQALEK